MFKAIIFIFTLVLMSCQKSTIDTSHVSGGEPQAKAKTGSEPEPAQVADVRRTDAPSPQPSSGVDTSNSAATPKAEEKPKTKDENGASNQVTHQRPDPSLLASGDGDADSSKLSLTDDDEPMTVIQNKLIEENENFVFSPISFYMFMDGVEKISVDAPDLKSLAQKYKKDTVRDIFTINGPSKEHNIIYNNFAMGLNKVLESEEDLNTGDNLVLSVQSQLLIFDPIKNKLTDKANKTLTLDENSYFTQADVHEKVNDWIEKETNNNMSDVFIFGDFTIRAFVLTQLSFIKSPWKYKFSQREKAEFTLQNKEVKKVKMMERKDISVPTRYHLTEDDRMYLYLPFESLKSNGEAKVDFGMVYYFNPKVTLQTKCEYSVASVGNVKSFYGQFISSDLPEFNTEFSEMKHIIVPKLALEQRHDEKLVEAMQEYESKAFHFFRQDADFRSLFEQSTIDKKLDYGLGEVTQVLKIDIDENGGSAVAATTTTTGRSIEIPDPNLCSINLNGPFAFAIVGQLKEAGAPMVPLFQGMIVDPSL